MFEMFEHAKIDIQDSKELFLSRKMQQKLVVLEFANFLFDKTLKC